MAKSNYLTIKNLLLGGIAESDHLGRNNAEMGNIVGLDIHTEPGTFRVNQKLAKDSGATITEFVKDIVECSTGDLYFFSSESGKIWEKDVSAGTYSLVDTAVPTDGEAKCLGAIEYGGYIYWATQNWLHRIAVKDVSSWSSNVEENWKALNEFDGAVINVPKVLSFNGVDHYVETDSTQFGLTSADTFTFSCWFKLTGDGEDALFTVIAAGTGRIGITLGTAATDDTRYVVRIYEGGVGNLAVSENDVIKQNEWTHLAITRGGTGSDNLTAYINGKEIPLSDNSPTNSFVDTAEVKTIGASSNPSNFFEGQISRISFIDSELSAANVLALYEGQYFAEVYTFSSGAYYAGHTYNNGLGYSYATDFLKDSEERIFPHPVEIPTSIAENGENSIECLSLHSPFSKVDLWIGEKASANVTITLHDEDDNSLGTATLTNANITEGDWNTFDFTDFEVEYGQKVHIHITASGSGAYIKSRNPETLNDSAIKLYSTGSTAAHPMQIVNRDLYIGDRNLVHKVTRNTGDGKHYFIANALDIPQPYEIECLGQSGNNLVIGASVGDDIHKSSVFVWDTWSVSFNTSDEIEEDGINAIIPADNYVIISAGKHGNLYMHDGKYLTVARQIKGDYFPSGGSDVGVRVNPNAHAIYKRLPMFGLSNVSGNPASQGVYSIGGRSTAYPVVLNLEYPLSPRSSGEFVLEGLEVGAMKVNAGILYVSWRHDTDGEGTYAYGVDAIDLSTKLEEGYFETRYSDFEIYSNKELVQYIANWTALPTSTALKLFLDQDYAGYGSELSFEKDASFTRSKVDHSTKFRTLRLKFVLETNSNNSPVVESLILLPRL